jgi:hypothetical protein
MGQFQPPADPSTVWLRGLIDAMDEVATSETVARGVVASQRQKEVEEIRSAEWEAFRKGLRIQEATIKGDVKWLSDKFRHGNFIDTSWDERKRALSLTWEIIRRYMFYLRGKGDLPELDFPLV